MCVFVSQAVVCSKHLSPVYVSKGVFVFVTVRVCEGHPHRRWSWGLHSLRRPHGGWRCCGSCSSPPAWSSWPSWPLRWLRWQLLPPLLSGLERGGRGDRALTDRYMSAGAEPLHLQNLSETCPGKKKKKNNGKEFWNNKTMNNFIHCGISAYEITAWFFIFWQGISSQQVIMLMGWIPVCVAEYDFYECFTNSGTPRHSIDVFVP